MNNIDGGEYYSAWSIWVVVHNGYAMCDSQFPTHAFNLYVNK